MAASIYQEPLYVIPGKVVVVVPEPWSAIPTQQTELLDKILASVHQSLSSVQVVESNQFSVEKVKVYAPSLVLIFGCETSFELQPYACLPIDGIPVLKAPLLEALDAAEKRKLWDALKDAFRLR